MKNKFTTLYKVKILCKDGRKIPLEISMTTLLDDDGNEVGMLGIARDVSDRLEAEKKIIIERNRAEFYLDLLSHDIANIQQGIYTAVQLAELRKDDEDYKDRIINNIKKLSSRSITLLNNAKILSKIGDMEMKVEPVNLSSIIRENINDMKRVFQEEDISIDMKAPEKDVYVDAAPLITNIFFNLLHNGIKFQTNGSKKMDVRISPKPGGKIVEISIADRGPGIPDEMKEVIFQRHKKGGDTRLSGIGLSLVKELVDRYKGTIRVEDRKEGRGANFIVTLPMASG
jgi:signal transduction histidine kinase